MIPGAVERNTEYVGDDIAAADDVDEAHLHLGFDAQTSGGLLIAVPEQRHEALRKALAARGAGADTIGRIVGTSSGRIEVVVSAGDETQPVAAEQDDLPQAKAAAAGGEQNAPCCTGAQQQPAAPCCPDAGGATTEGPGELSAVGPSTTPSVMRAFGEMMRLTGADGALDRRTKKLLHFALSVITKCGPCTAIHREAALKMGITPAQLEEAVWCAIAMGGAPVRMFYQETLQRPDGQ